MRAFFGVPLPALGGLVELLARLRGSGADLKVVRDDHFHLTLKFFGEIREEACAAFLKLVRQHELPPPFELALRDVGAFPNWKRFNILWAGVEDPTGSLAQLHVAAERAWVGLGHTPEGRGFTPHLTLARKRSDGGQDEAKAVLNEYRARDFGTARIDRVNLYRSTLTPEGPVYDVVGAVTL